jgi:hypothetical protein
MHFKRKILSTGIMFLDIISVVLSSKKPANISSTIAPYRNELDYSKPNHI